MNKEFEKLQIALYNMSKPLVDHLQKERVKKAVFNNIKHGVAAELGSVKRLQLAIKKLSAVVKPSAVFAAKVKESVFAFIEKNSTGPSFFKKFVWNVEKVFASLLLVTFATGIFFVYVADIPITKAAKRTYISEVTGRVDVMRGTELLSAYAGMELEEGDTVVSEETGLAEIRYCDDSITRISPKTQLKLKKLFIDKENFSKTNVEVELLNGRVWSQVVNLVGGESSFNVKTTEVKATVENKASFDVKNTINTQKTEVAVFSNKVKVAIPKSYDKNDKLLLEGYSIEVNNQQPKQEKIIIKPDISENETWVKNNKAKDKKYVAKVTEEVKVTQKEQAGVLPDDPFYTAKKLNEGTKLLVTSDPDEKVKLQIEIAKKRLIEANALYSEGKIEQAQSVLNDFKGSMEQISPLIVASDELKNYAETQFSEESKKLALILPDNPSYPIKEALREAKEKLINSPEEQKSVALDHASQKINEAKDLISENKSDMAVETIQDVKNDVKLGIASSQDAALTLADAKVLTEALQQEACGDCTSDTRKLNKLAQETETALNTELLQAVVSETQVVEDIQQIIPTPNITQIQVVENIGEADIAVIIPLETKVQE